VASLARRLAAALRLYAVHQLSRGLLVAGVVLGAMGDGAAARFPAAPWLGKPRCGLRRSPIAGAPLHRRTGLALDGASAARLVIGVVFAAGLACATLPPMKLLALAARTMTCSSRLTSPPQPWVRRSGSDSIPGAAGAGRT